MGLTSNDTRTVGAVTFISTIAGTLALLFGFFGINAAQVNERISMFDHRYLSIYLIIALIIVIAVGIYLTLPWQEKRATNNRPEKPRPPEVPPSAGAIVVNPYGRFELDMSSRLDLGPVAPHQREGRDDAVSADAPLAGKSDRGREPHPGGSTAGAVGAGQLPMRESGMTSRPNENIGPRIGSYRKLADTRSQSSPCTPTSVSAIWCR